MNSAETFLRFAAECSSMAEFTRTPENKTLWSAMAERWIRCAESMERQSAMTRHDHIAKRHRRAPASSRA